MQITSITKLKADKYEIFVDGELYAVLDGVVLLSNRLKVGMEIEDRKLLQIKCESDQNLAFNEGIKYLSRARKTESEVRQKLLQKGYEECAIDGAITKLISYGYVDDEAYARAYVSIYQSTRGKNRLRYELSLKGISRGVIESALPEDEYQSAYKLAEKKISKYGDREKLIKYLISRGYEYELSRRVVGDLEEV